MSRLTARLLIALAVLILAIGGYGLLSTITVFTDNDDSVDCGTAIAPDYMAGHRAACSDARDDRNLWAIPAILIGGIGCIGLPIAYRRATTRKAAE